MEKAGSHAASILASLNLQREQAQFCDGVIRLRENPGQLYLAHRCILAASSPVLASILSATGTLVELQVPFLSDTVLRLVLDYIYRGTLPYNHSQQQYSSLLSAARYLQMDELEETLRAKVNYANNTAAENQQHNVIKNYCKTVNSIIKYLPSDPCSGNSLDREDKNWDDRDMCGSKNENGADNCFRAHTSPLSNASNNCSVSESTGYSINTDSRQQTYLTPQHINPSIPFTADMTRMSRVGKDVQQDQFYSAGTVKPESRQLRMEEERVETVENRSVNLLCPAEVQEEHTSRMGETQFNQTEKNGEEEHKIQHLKANVAVPQCFPHSPKSLYLCCEAVPVIRHGSEVAMSDASSVPLSHPESQIPARSSRASDSQSGSADNDKNVESRITRHTNSYRPQDQDSTNHKDHTGTQILSYKHSSDQDTIKDLYCKSNRGQLAILKQERSSSSYHDEYMDRNFHQVLCNSSQNHTRLCKDDLTSPNEDINKPSQGLKHIAGDDFTLKHQKPYRHKLLLANASAEQTIQPQDPSAVDPLLPQGSSKGSNSHYGNLCPAREGKEEQSYSIKSLVDMEKQDSLHNWCGPQHDRYSTVHRAERSTTETVSCQDEHAEKNATAQISLEHDNSSDCWTSEPLQNKDDLSDHIHNCTGQSYHGQIHYHYVHNDDAELSHTDPDDKSFVVSQPGHSDQSSVDEDVGTSPGPGSLRQHFAVTDKVLLLDISGKPAELHKPVELEKSVALNRRETSRNDYKDNDRQQQGKALTKKRQIRRGTKRVAESLNETKTKIWVNETSTEEGKSNGKVQSSLTADAAHKAREWEGDNQTTSLTARSSPHVPDSVETDVSSTLSARMPSNLSASMPRNTSANLSPPAPDPIQCSLCSRAFSQRGSLNRHMRSHLGLRPFPCPRCPMTFSRQYRVLEHMRVHQRCDLGSAFQKSPTSLMYQNSESSIS